jgi:hypothetical protein
MTHTENRIAADQLRELGKSRLHKDVWADAKRLALYPELVELIDKIERKVISSQPLTDEICMQIDRLLNMARSIK